MIETRDQALLRTFLRQDCITHAYQLGDLNPMFFKFSRWFAIESSPGTLDSVMLLYSGLRLPVVLTTGSDEGVAALFEATRDVLPERFHYHVHKRHLDALRAVHTLPRSPRPMVRMALRRDDFRDDIDTCEVVSVGHRDTASLIALYRFYPDNFFDPYQMETGLYFGIRNEDQLVSIAGVHMVSPEDDVAAIGNLVTHPNHRGRGFATCCTARLLRDVFKRVSMAALSVRQDNEPAVRTFQRLGFETHHVYFEGHVGID